MHNFRKALVTSVLFVLCVIMLSACVIAPYFNTEAYPYEDAALRKSYSGTLDTLYLGSSHAYRAFQPVCIDEKLGTHSYNLSYSMMTMQGRYALLQKELERNPVTTVYLEVSYNALTRDRDREGPEGDIYLLGRFDNVFERVKYFFSALRLDEYGSVYYDMLDRGTYAIAHRSASAVPSGTRGYGPLESKDQSLSAQDYRALYHTQSVTTAIYAENERYLRKCIELCQDRGIRVVLVVTPIAAQTVCKFDNLDVINGYYLALCEEYGLAFYDFNLLKDRPTLLSEKTSFFDATHLSEEGARIFSETFAEVVSAAARGDSVRERFYASYAEADAIYKP